MSLRILIVEDEFLLAFDIQCALEEAGHDVVGWAADSASARRIAASSVVDVALVDLNLKDGATGAELGHAFAESGIIVVYLTANGGDLPAGLNGAVGIVDKPCDQRHLARLLRRAARQMRRSLNGAASRDAQRKGRSPSRAA